MDDERVGIASTVDDERRWVDDTVDDERSESTVKHPDHVVGWNGGLAGLAQAVGNMSYDQTAHFIELLADDIMKQGDNDEKKGRERLAAELYETAQSLLEAKNNMNKAWKICKPYVDDES